MRSGHSWSGHERNVCFVNKGNGAFSDISYLSGAGFVDDARGLAALDWDNDGDLDIWMNNRSSPRLRFLRNDSGSKSHYVNLKLVGSTCNRDAVGARVEVHLPDRTLIKTVRSGVNYTVQGSTWVHFGLDQDDVIESIGIRWPDGSTTRHENVAADGRYVILQKDSKLLKYRGIAPTPSLAPSILNVPPMSQVASVPLGARLPLPDTLEFSLFDGPTKRLADFAGQPVLINLWASWCTNCVQELKGFVSERQTLEQAGVVVLACSVDDPKDLQAAIDMSKRLKFWFPTGTTNEQTLSLIDVIKNSTFDRYTPLPMPSSLLIDSRGRLARIYLGPCKAWQVADDVRTMESAQTDIEVLEQAANDKLGIWHRPYVWSETQIGEQLNNVLQFCLQDGLNEFAAFYARQLGEFLGRENRTAKAIKKYSNMILSAAHKSIDSAPESAEQLFRMVSSLDPTNGDALIGLTAALAAKGDGASLAEASRTIQSVLGNLPEPTNSKDFAAYGNLLISIGKFNEAIPYLEKAHQADADDKLVAAQLGSALVNTGRIEDGVTLLENSLSEMAPNAQFESVLASAYEQQDQQEKAGLRHQRVIELTEGATSVEDILVRGESNFYLNHWSDAARDLEIAIGKWPDKALQQLKLAIALTNLNRDSDAIKHFEAAVPNLNQSAKSELAWGMALARLKDFENAIEHFKKALEIEPGLAMAIRSLGTAYQLIGKPSDAAAAYTSYLRENPDDFEISQRVADIALTQGSVDEAVRVMRGIIASDKADEALDAARYKLAWLLAANPSDEIRNGKEAIKLALTLTKNVGRRIGVLDLLAAAYAENGDFESAVEIANEALTAATTDNPKMVEPIRSRIALYQNRKPFRTQDAN